MIEENTTKKNKGGNPNFIPKWKAGKTRAIRVPDLFADQLLYIARLLDNGLTVDQIIDNAMKPDQSNHQQNLDEVKIKVLKSLKLGTTSPVYKKVEKALNSFISILKEEKYD